MISSFFVSDGMEDLGVEWKQNLNILHRIWKNCLPFHYWTDYGYDPI